MTPIECYRFINMEAAKREILLNVLDKIAEEQKYVDYKVDVKDISSDGANMSAALVFATLSAKEKVDLNLFGKVATLGEGVRNTTPMPSQFITEFYFYKTLVKEFERIQEKHSIPEEHRLIFPKEYGRHEEYLNETIVLENLTKQGFETYDRLKSIDLEYATKAIEILAKFHALSLAWYEEEPEEVEAILKNMVYDFTQVLAGLQFMKPKMLEGVYGATEEEYMEKLKKYLEPEDGSDNFVHFLNMCHPKKPGLIVHGDFKASNLMHKRRNGKLAMIPVDFQIVRNGSPVYDLVYFLVSSADEQFRRQHYHQLLDVYYEQLRLALERLHVDPEKAYPEETYRKELKEYEMLGLMIGVVLLPMIVVAEESMPSFDGDADVSTMMVSSGNLYKERFNGLLKNYVEWGLL